jgi:hypothetical protein
MIYFFFFINRMNFKKQESKRAGIKRNHNSKEGRGKGKIEEN